MRIECRRGQTSPAATRVFPCPAPNVGSSAFACPACCHGELRFAVGLHEDAQTGFPIAFARSELLRRRAGFPDPVSTAVCSCTVLGFPCVNDPLDRQAESAAQMPPPHLLPDCSGWPAGSGLSTAEQRLSSDNTRQAFTFALKQRSERNRPRWKPWGADRSERKIQQAMSPGAGQHLSSLDKQRPGKATFRERTLSPAFCRASGDWASFQTKSVSAEPIHGLLSLRDTRGHLIRQFGRHGAAGSRSCITTSILAIRSLSSPISDQISSILASRSLKSSRMSLRRSLISPRRLEISALSST